MNFIEDIPKEILRGKKFGILELTLNLLCLVLRYLQYHEPNKKLPTLKY